MWLYLVLILQLFSPNVCVVANGGGFFDQKLDHFNPTDSTNFNQLYYTNDAYYKDGSGAPELLLLPEPNQTHFAFINDADRPLCQYAKSLGSRLWLLEPRFYGASRPFASYSKDNLQLLSSDQAVEDAKQFIEKIGQLYKLQKGNWIVFGGGKYSGLLVLRLRQNYHGLTIGVVASSPLLRPKLDFYDYNQHVAQVYKNYNQKCYDNIAHGFKFLRQLMDNRDGRDQLDQAFQLKPKFSEIELTDQIFQHFYLRVMKSFLIPVENNNVNKSPFDKGAGVKDICDLMLKPSVNPVGRLITVRKYILKQLQLPSDYLDIDYMGEINELKVENASNERAWLWQKCTELASFQTTQYNNENLWGSLLQLNYFVNRCTDVFGSDFNVSRVSAKIEEQKDFQLTNTIIVNNLIDPWSKLSLNQVSTNIDSKVLVIDLKTTSHMADFHPERKLDPFELREARDKILTEIQNWVKSQLVFKPIINPKIIVERESDKIINWDAKIYPNGGGANSDLSSDGWYFIEHDFNHFQQPNGKKFNQSFAISFQHYKPGGPIFFAISGETPGMTYAEFTDHTQPGYLAPDFNALLVLLEHRFYGSSEVGDDLNQSNLQWLTVDQALADIAIFIHTINKVKSFESPKWVTFGCSYAGGLSAWLRSKYPEFTTGAFSSSPLMFPKVDLYEYTQAVDRVYNQVNCHEEIQSAFSQVQQLFLTVEGRNELNAAFVLCQNFTQESIDERDRQTFFHLLTQPFTNAVENSLHLKTVSGICNIMKNKDQSSLERLNHALGFYICLNWSYQSELANYKSLDYDYKNYGQRQWLWQKCNQLGSFPSTDSGYNLFGSSVPIEFHLQLCSDIFGPQFERQKIEMNLKGVRKDYGDLDSFNATNLLIISSSNDPWGSLALQQQDSTDITFIVNKDNSHCSDTKPPMIDEENKKLYKKLRDQLKIWLNV